MGLFDKKNYILYDNINSQWNNGHINVYIKGESVEYIFVDEYLRNNKDDEIWGVSDIIESLKIKYNIKEVITKETNWR